MSETIVNRKVCGVLVVSVETGHKGLKRAVRVCGVDEPLKLERMPNGQWFLPGFILDRRDPALAARVREALEQDGTLAVPVGGHASKGNRRAASSKLAFGGGR